MRAQRTNGHSLGTALCVLMLGHGLSFGASTPQPKVKRPKVKITFDRADFQASYGQTAEFCMKVNPRIPFKTKVVFASNPAGAFVGNFGGTATCPDSSYDSIQVKASPDTQCVASATLLIKVNSKTVGSLPGTITLPTDENHTLIANFQDTCTTGFDQLFYLTFVGNGTGAPANFKGVPVQEIHDFTGLPNSCGMERFPTQWTIGVPEGSLPVPLGPNQIDDANSKCGGTGELASCVTQLRQRFKVGACPPTPEYVHTFRVNASGVGCVQRGDPLAPGGTPGDCPP